MRAGCWKIGSVTVEVMVPNLNMGFRDEGPVQDSTWYQLLQPSLVSVHGGNMVTLVCVQFGFIEIPHLNCINNVPNLTCLLKNHSI